LSSRLCFPMTADKQKRVAITSVGCKTNQYEALWLASTLKRQGLQVVGFDETADAYVVFTCAVTRKAEADSRKLARRGRRKNPSALVVATGCGVQLEPRTYIDKGGADVAVGMNERATLTALIAATKAESDTISLEHKREPAFTPFGIGDTGVISHSRAWLKIQEGCDANCSYCIVPKLRGPSRSIPPELVLDEATRLAERFNEIVLVGTNIGLYGRDLSPRTSLAELVARILALAEKHGFRARLSSVEPMDFDDALIELARTRQMCPHFHIPLQGTTDRLLKEMNRPYTTREFADLIERIKSKVPHASIGTDVIAGFPTESAQDFNEGCNLVESLPLSYMHIFSYSPRPDTPAAELKPQPNEVVRERAAKLKGIDAKKRGDFANSQVGRPLEVAVTKSERGKSEGLSENYLRTRIAQSLDVGSLVKVAVEKSEGQYVIGKTETPQKEIQAKKC